MKLSIVICTWKRPAALAETLATLAGVADPDCEWEVVVVSNDCSEATAAAVRPWLGRMPLRLVEEPIAGLSHARNRGITEAAGDYIIWADDDVLFDRGWLRAYERAFRERPDAAFFGGTILPVLAGNPPAWLKAALPFIGNVYAARHPEGDLAPIIPDALLPFGANYAVRTAEQRQHPYDAGLGRQPGGMVLGGEETCVFRQLFDDGHAGVWVPGAVLQHVMPPERQTHAYLRKYYEGYGWQEAGAKEPLRSRRQRLRYRLRAAYYEALFRLLFAMGAPSRRWLKALKQSAMITGRLRYAAERAAAPVGKKYVLQFGLM